MGKDVERKESETASQISPGGQTTGVSMKIDSQSYSRESGLSAATGAEAHSGFLVSSPVAVMLCLCITFFLLGRWWGKERQKTIGGLVVASGQSAAWCAGIMTTSAVVAWLR